MHIYCYDQENSQKWGRITLIKELEKISENYRNLIYTVAYLNKNWELRFFFFFFLLAKTIKSNVLHLNQYQSPKQEKICRKRFHLLGTNKHIPRLWWRTSSKFVWGFVCWLAFVVFWGCSSCTWSHRKNFDVKVQAKVCGKNFTLKPYTPSDSCSGATVIFGPSWKQICSYTLQTIISKMLTGRLQCLEHSIVWRAHSIYKHF